MTAPRYQHSCAFPLLFVGLVIGCGGQSKDSARPAVKPAEVKNNTDEPENEEPPAPWPPKGRLAIGDPDLDADLGAITETSTEMELKIEEPRRLEKPTAHGRARLSEVTEPPIPFDPDIMDELPGPYPMLAFQCRFDQHDFRLNRKNSRNVRETYRLGMNADTARAAAMGMGWIAKQQLPDGGWRFDGMYREDRIAATGMCLLPFLADGETHLKRSKYRERVANGVFFLRSQLNSKGQFGSSNMYSQAIATIVLCELAGMSGDTEIRSDAERAVEFIVKAQGPNGSWGYAAGTEGDTSIVGWNIQALQAARFAGIRVPDKAFKQAEAFLKSVSSDNGATYGYRAPGETRALTAMGLLCRQYMGWNSRNPSLGRGVNILVDRYPVWRMLRTEFDVSYLYHASQVIRNFGGPDWDVKWHPVARQMLINLQITERPPNYSSVADIGSWPKDDHLIGMCCGKLGTTALATLTLQVYYRYNISCFRNGELRQLEPDN